MIGRHIPPGHSPLGLGALAASALRAPLVREHDALLAHVHRDYGSLDALLTDSGTSALTVALKAGRQERDGAPVALPAYGCYDLATAALGAGAPVILYDLNPESLAPDPATLQAALEAGARILVLSNLFGVPADDHWVWPLAAAYDALVIEDAAQAVGTWAGDRMWGSRGSLSVLSFGRGKGRTGGGGGALLANDPWGVRLLDRARMALGPPAAGAGLWIKAVAQWTLARPILYGIPSAIPALRLGETVFHAPRRPSGMPAVAAGILTRTWTAAEIECDARRRNTDRIWPMLTAHPALTPPSVSARGAGGWLRLPVLASPGTSARFRIEGAKHLGVLHGYPVALCDLPPLAPLRVRTAFTYPGARRLARDLFTLPTHSLLTRRDLARIEGWLEGLTKEMHEHSAVRHEQLEAELLR